MRRSKLTEEQISMVLTQMEAGTPVTDICRKLEVTETTFNRWRKKYGALGMPEPGELKQLCEENQKLVPRSHLGVRATTTPPVPA